MELLFFAAAFVAEVLGTMAGFGSAMILLPVSLLFFDFKTALVLVAFMHLFGNLGRVTFFRKSVTWRIVAYFGIIGIAGTFVGALLVPYADQEILKLYLGIFLIIYACFALFKRTFTMQPTKANMLAGGAASGFLAGIIGTGGALRSAFLNAYQLPKAQYISTAAIIAIALDLTRIPLYIKDGLMPTSYYWMLPVLFTAAVAGSYVGKKLVARIPQKAFAKVVLVCLVLAGIGFVIGQL